MNRKILLLPLLCLVVACGNNEKEAEAMYAQADLLYQSGDYIEATRWVDSISTTYPQEAGTIRKGMMLQCHINQKRYEQDVLRIDSMYNAASNEMNSLKGEFQLVRQGKEQTLANYIYKGTQRNKEVNRSELRVQVTEEGNFQLTSVYYGNAKLNHTGIHAKSANGASARTAVINYDGGKNYRYATGNKNVEMVTYNLSQCEDVVKLIVENAQEKIGVEYTGGKKHTLSLDKLSREAIINSYRLAQLFALTDSLQSQREYGIIQLELADRQLMKLQDKQAAKEHSK